MGRTPQIEDSTKRQIPKPQIQKNREDEGLFQFVDDAIIEKICPPNDSRSTLSWYLFLLISTNSRFKGVCQHPLTLEYDRLRNQPPNEIDHDQGISRWLDRHGLSSSAS